ncbi:pimeloyl-ACP methyl ester carboxylesterase [Algoriphagus sp. 4150]|uniref:alpha/beta fold hydrolase n=1 Tax=Algoriphagus sp. 4150 TaxID=2817756 RepID=UPI0028588BB4|nr:alpha/beta hydrolase [Algoriphagus sp. 4150]MDR7130579.1 pimeloyl-ACP methyl ester carboxylesterase [Algoriphagus sp. 4150]
MPFLKNNKGKEAVEIFYQDYGKGKPVILIHGWPLSHQSWEGQIRTLVEEGFRVIAYDRRGFGKSSQPWGDYDYTTLAGDLHELILHLDLNDVTLVGFSMGGGEVVRYFTEFGTDRISKAALIASIIPLVAQKEDNPEGVPQKVLEEILDALKTDRVGFLKGFHTNFYNYEKGAKGVSEANLDFDFGVASHASSVATIKAAEAWAGTDFRSELENVKVPTLIVHGDKDNIVPYRTSGEQAAKGIADNTYHLIKGAPHGLNLTHGDELNTLLLDFLKK